MRKNYFAKRTLKIFNVSKNLPRLLSREYAPVYVSSFLVLVATILFVPISFEGSETVKFSYPYEYKSESALEMGEQKIMQPGQEGESLVTYRYSQRLFDYLFRKENVEKQEINRTSKKEPVKEITLKGTRKWQYMICSDGGYRYYTDEQFKDPRTGFTSKSPDYCEQNGHGQKISLADSPAGDRVATRPSYVPPTCSLEEIPYRTVYEDVSWLDVGETMDGIGSNGYRLNCSDGSYGSSYEPLNKVVYRGTRQPQPTTTYTPTYDDTEYRRSIAIQECRTDYNNAKVQLSMYNASNSSAMDIVESLYAQCLARAQAL